MGVSVGDEGVKLPAAERCLVYGKILSHILRIKNVFLGMAELFPATVVTEDLLVLTRQVRPVNSVMGPYGTDAFRCRLYLYLLKKPRTPGSADCLLP